MHNAEPAELETAAAPSPADVAKVHFQIDVHAPPHAVPEFVRLKVFIKRLGRRLGLKVDEIRQTGITTTTKREDRT